MTEAGALQEVVLELPSEFAFELMEHDVVWPYIREDRVDPALIPAVVLSVSASVSTVVATKLTEGAVRSISRAVRRWLGPRSAGDQPTLRSPGAGTALVIDENTTDEQIADYLRQARGDSV